MSEENLKTPAMFLHEFTVKRRFPRPEYILTIRKIGTNKNEYHYKVVVSDVSAVGCGRSKKLAKHDAAAKALDIFTEQGLLKGQSYKQPSDCPLDHPENYIGILKNLCNKLKLSHPELREISIGGPPHLRKFTYECQLYSEITKSTASTKKEAKQLAAKDMLEKFRNISSDIEEKRNSKAMLTCEDEEIVKKFKLLSKTLDLPKLKETKDDFHMTLKKRMKEKDLKFEDFHAQFRKRNNEGLDYIFEKLDIKYEVEIFQESPPIACVVFNLDIPFTLMALGSSKNNAKINLVSQIFSVLDVCMSCDLDEED